MLALRQRLVPHLSPGLLIRPLGSRCRVLPCGQGRTFYQYLDKASHRLGSLVKETALKAGLSGGTRAVGQDQDGNKYYEEPPTYVGGAPKRSVQTPGGLGDAFDFDVNSVPSEWRHWLSGSRIDPCVSPICTNHLRNVCRTVMDSYCQLVINGVPTHICWFGCSPTPEELEGRARELEALHARVRAIEAEEVKYRLSGSRGASTGPVAPTSFERSVLAAADGKDLAPAGQQQRNEPTGQGESFKPGAWVP